MPRLTAKLYLITTIAPVRVSVCVPVCPLMPTIKSGSKAVGKYTVLLPTYNERQNLPIIVWMLVKVFAEQ